MDTADRVVLSPAESSVALVPQRVVSAERVALAREHKRARKAEVKYTRLVGERNADRRIIVALEESIRRWSATHAASEARLRRWKTAAWVLGTLLAGDILVMQHPWR